jgi:glycosyltransferase involved in cell wall biosynthesis
MIDKISIITATYNCVDEIEISIKSVIEQDYPVIEYIIIDGGSTDGTLDIIKKYDNYITYWVSEPDKGLYYAMNKGIERATGEWIYIHNAGGVFADKNVLSKIFNLDLTQIDAVFGYEFSKTANKLLRFPIPFYEQKTKDKRPGYSHQALFTRTKWMKEYPFDTNYRCCADYNQAVQIYNKGAVFKYVDVFVCYSAVAGFSARNRRLQLIETAKINGLNNTGWFKRQLLLFDIKSFIKKVGGMPLKRVYKMVFNKSY